MLTREIMGALALWILWVNTLLIAADAGIDLRSLLARRRALSERDRGDRLVRATVLRGEGPAGELAALRIEQIGRFGKEASGKRVILFADRSAKAEAFGGVAKLEGGAELAIPPGAALDLWFGPEELARAAACPCDGGFDAAYEEARKARGHVRTVHASIGSGREIFVFGRLTQRGEGFELSAPEGGAMLLAAFDPRPWLARKALLVAAFIVGELAVAAGLSAIALHEPRFGVVSSAGAFLALLFFLTVQPAGVAVRDAVRAPSCALLRGRWVRSAPVTSDSTAPERAAAIV